VCVCVRCAAHHKVVRRLLSVQQSLKRRHLSHCSALRRRQLLAEIVSLKATDLTSLNRKMICSDPNENSTLRFY